MIIIIIICSFVFLFFFIVLFLVFVFYFVLFVLNHDKKVGIDVGAHVSHDLSAAFGQRMSGANNQLLEDMVSAGFLGRKSGKVYFFLLFLDQYFLFLLFFLPPFLKK